MINLHNIYDENCTKCDLHSIAKKVCIGHKGETTNIKLIVCGEAPGTDENRLGVPFVGKAGQLLDDLIERAEIDKDSVFFTNVTRCFPNDSGITRQPTKVEVEACLPYLYETFLKIKEENKDGYVPYIVALGNEALEALTGNRKISSNRGKEFPLLIHRSHKEKYGHLSGVFTVVGVIHPSAVLRGLTAAESQIISDLHVLWMKINGKQNRYWEKYKWIDDIGEFGAYVEKALNFYKNGKIPFIAYDLETTGLNCYDKNEKVVVFSLCFENEEGIVVPIDHKDSPWKDNDDTISKEIIIELLGKILTEIPIAGWNILFDVKWTELKLGLKIKEIGFDGFLASRWIFGETLLKHDLNSRAEEILKFHGHGVDVWNEVEEQKEKQEKHMGNVKKEVIVRYAAGDADATFQLSMKYKSQMEKAGILDSFMELPIRSILPIASMEMAGVYIDPDVNYKLQKEFPGLMQPIIEYVKESKWGKETQKILSERKKPLDFNLGSDITLRELLFSRMKLPEVKSGKKGASSDKEALEILTEYCETHNLKDRLEILQKINEWRGLKHTYNNFIKNISVYTAADGFFHTSYNIAGTVTGRISSSKPSIHGQPKGSKARWQFVSRWQKDGGLILSGDMSQAEMRVLASLSKDKNLIDTILSGTDLHTANASKMFKIPVEEVTKKQRDLAKRAGFGVVYGIGAQTLAGRIESSIDEAQNIIDSWYEAFPNTLSWQREQYNSAKKHGFLMTQFGRIRHIQDVKKSHWGDKAWRQSINFPIQSVASDVTFSALLEVVNEIGKLNLKSKVFGFIHDAIVVDIFPNELLTILQILKKKMVLWTNTTHDWILAPMDADYEFGSSWGLPCKVKKFDNSKIEVTGDTLNSYKLQLLLEKVYSNISVEELEKETNITVSLLEK